MSSGYNGFIMLNKEIKRHEYYTDIKIMHLYIHLLLDANFTDSNWKGQIIKRGQKATSVNSLVIETGLTIKEVRTGLDKLIKGNYLVKKGTNKYTLLTLTEYEYLTNNIVDEGKQKTNKRQTKDKPTATIEEVNNIKIGERDKENSLKFFFLILKYME
jgi:hypothetical protein